MQDLPEAQLDVFERNTDRFIDRLGSVAERANKGMLRAMGFLGEKAGAGVTFTVALGALMKSVIETPLVTEAQVRSFLDSAELVLVMTIAALGAIVTEG